MTRMLVLLFAALMIGVPGVGRACPAAPQGPLPTAELAIETASGRYIFTVEEATTPDQRSCGLMQRPRLARDAGMIFRQSPPGRSYFWMKNTPEPLDMLFLDQDGRVVHYVEYTVPYSTGAYGTEAEVAAVLELRAGSAGRMSLDLGDKVEHHWFKR